MGFDVLKRAGHTVMSMHLESWGIWNCDFFILGAISEDKYTKARRRDCITEPMQGVSKLT